MRNHSYAERTMVYGSFRVKFLASLHNNNTQNQLKLVRPKFFNQMNAPTSRTLNKYRFVNSDGNTRENLKVVFLCTKERRPFSCI